ncbi:uncharacterized protein CTRU02_207344 [Colletotrichum truncatum]|uniref:Uncharacterized protein n=1 Tax=Colletotrichum truncatum TaxID=5467 RepID=A0ACC3Z0J1_COLTU
MSIFTAQEEHANPAVHIDEQILADARVFSSMSRDQQIIQGLSIATNINNNLIVLNSKFDALKSDVAAIKSDVAAIKSDVAAIKSDVAVLKSDVAVLKSDVAVLKSDVAVLKSDVAVLKSDVAVLKSDVAVLKSDVAAIKSDVAAFDFTSQRLKDEVHEIKTGIHTKASASEVNTSRRLANRQSIKNHLGPVLPQAPLHALIDPTTLVDINGFPSTHQAF